MDIAVEAANNVNGKYQALKEMRDHYNMLCKPSLPERIKDGEEDI